MSAPLNRDGENAPSKEEGVVREHVHEWSILPIGEDSQLRTYWCVNCEATYDARYVQGEWRRVS